MPSEMDEAFGTTHTIIGSKIEAAPDHKADLEEALDALERTWEYHSTDLPRQVREVLVKHGRL